MKKIFIYLILSINVIFSFGQGGKLIIWNHLLEFKKEIKISDSNLILTRLHEEIINSNDIYFLCYFGQNISNPINYKFIYNPIEVNLYGYENGEAISSFKDFKMDDSLHNDCDPIKDSLPDGLWMLIKKNNDFTIQIAYQKSILNNVLHGFYITKYENNKILTIEKYSNGFHVDTTFSYDVNGSLKYICFWADTCNEIIFSFNLDSNNIISYYNKYLGYNLNFRTKDHIRKIVKFKEGIKIYKTKNKLFKIKYYYK